MKTSKSGSVIGATLIIAVTLTLVLAGIMKWVHTETRVSRSSVLNTRARYAAESSAEFALAQMRATLQREPIVTTNMFTAAGTPPVRPDASILGTTASATLRDLGATTGGSGGATYRLLDDVIGTVTRALDHGSEATTHNAGRFTIGAGILAVSPVGAEYPLWMNPSNPLYAGDPLRGQTIPVREIRVFSSARAADTALDEGAMAYCMTTLQLRNVPLFRYISYYNLDLELSPAAGMDVYGPIHTNRNMYVQGGSNGTETSFHNVVTAAGGIFHGRAPGVALSANPGDVAFGGPGGTLVDMHQGSGWVDSRTEDWAGRSMSLWDGNVLSGTHGVVPALPAPIPVDAPETAIEDLSNAAHVLIEPATLNPSVPELEILKYSSKASIVFEIATSTTTATVGSGSSAQEVLTTTITPRAFRYVRDEANGQYVRRDGDAIQRFRREEINVPDNLWSYGEFYDNRWDRRVKSADLDVGRLKTLIESSSSAAEWTRGSVEFNPQTDWNGVVYVEQTNTTDAAVRLCNGRQVPNLPTPRNDETRGFTVATNAPLYIWGNYNADGSLPSNPQDIQSPDNSSEPPTAIVADAVTVLSNDWQDSNSTRGIGARKASQTEIAAAVIGGIVPSTNGEYSGGWHNMVRMLEDWSNVKLAYRSSMVVLYTSVIADTPWAGQSPVYEPPTRLFGLNTLFQRGIMPPGTDPTPSLRRLNSRILSEEEFNTAVTALGVTP